MNIKKAKIVLLQCLKNLELEHHAGINKLYFYFPSEEFLRKEKLKHTTIGYVNPEKGFIALNKIWVICLSDEESFDTVKHEYSHAIDRYHNDRMGHSISWKVIAASLGASPNQGKYKHNSIESIKIKIMYKIIMDIGRR